MAQGGTDSMFESTGVEIVSNEDMLCTEEGSFIDFLPGKTFTHLPIFCSLPPATSLALVMLLLSEVRSSVEKLVYIY